MQRLWLRCGPPAYRALAHYLGLVATDNASRLDDPDELVNFLRTVPGGMSA
jgi:hypothetical protein